MSSIHVSMSWITKSSAKNQSDSHGLSKRKDFFHISDVYSGFYEEAIQFMHNFFSGGFKDNQNLSYGFLTGILRVAKESIFSGLNNQKVNSILSDTYGAYFGFTSDEVKTMAQHYGAYSNHKEICDWYDDYFFCNTEIFNPWSVVSYFDNNCHPAPFWQSTSSNDIIREVLACADDNILEKLTRLMLGQSFVAHIDTSVIYPEIRNNPSSVFSFLLVAGYLKAVRYEKYLGEDFLCELALPNREISYVFRKEILSSKSFIHSFFCLPYPGSHLAQGLQRIAGGT